MIENKQDHVQTYSEVRSLCDIRYYGNELGPDNFCTLISPTDHHKPRTWSDIYAIKRGHGIYNLGSEETAYAWVTEDSGQRISKVQIRFRASTGGQMGQGRKGESECYVNVFPY